MTEYKWTEAGSTFSFKWPDDWDESLRAAFVREVYRSGGCLHPIPEVAQQQPKRDRV